MRTSSFTFFLLAFLLFFQSCKENEAVQPPGIPALTEEQKAMVAQLDETVIPIKSADPNQGNDELEILDYLGNARIVGLGEATHGTRDFFQMKDRIFRYLVEEHGFRAFVFEMDLAEATLFNDYVQGKPTPALEILMKEKMIFWTWRTEEVFDLLQWMKTYNDHVIDGQKLSFFGVDCQHNTYNVDFLVNSLRDYDQAFADSVNFHLWGYRQLSFNYYETQQPGNDPIEAEVNYVYNEIQMRETEIVAALSQPAFDKILHLARSVVQVRQTLYGIAFEPSVNYRDRFMAENTTWVSNFLGTGSKIALWAHNFHVSDYAGFSSQGNFLKQEWGNDYKIIGFGFSGGAFSAVRVNAGLTTHMIDGLPPANSSNFLFHHAEADNFILKFEDLPVGGAMARYLTEEHLFLSIGAVYNNVIASYYRDTPLAHRYDALIYFDAPSAAVQLE